MHFNNFKFNENVFDDLGLDLPLQKTILMRPEPSLASYLNTDCRKSVLSPVVEVLKEYYYKEGGRSSIPYSAFSRELLVEDKGGAYLHYLPAALKYAKMEARGVFKTDTCQDEEKSV